MAEYLLEMRGIVKEFAGVKALDGIDLKVRPGECVGLVRRERRRQVDADESAVRRLSVRHLGRDDPLGRQADSRPSTSATPKTPASSSSTRN